MTEHVTNRWFAGRFLDGKLELLLVGNVEPGPGYAVEVATGRIFRNGRHVGLCTKLTYDRDALGWWVEYLSWAGSSLDPHRPPASIFDVQEDAPEAPTRELGDNGTGDKA